MQSERHSCALPRVVDFTDDRVVADVLLDGVLEVDRAHASLSIARSLALRARGLRASSSAAGNQRFAGQHPERLAAGGERPERVLDDAVLERVKRDDGEPGARGQPAGRRDQKSVQPLELAVDPDPQRLKRPRRRIDPLVAAARDGAPHDLRELAGRRDRRQPPRLDDAARDPPREALFAELKDHVGQRFLVD